MKYEEDALRAVSGVLQRLQATAYPKGFFWGLPIEDFDWALVWRSQYPPERRTGFPSWTWAGWKGAIHTGYFLDLSAVQRIPVDLHIFKYPCGQHPETVFESNSGNPGNRENCLVILDDPVHAIGQLRPKIRSFQDVSTDALQTGGQLLVDAVLFQFLPDFSKPRSGVPAQGRYETFSFHVLGIYCTMVIMSTDRLITAQLDEEQTFILLARCCHRDNVVVHHLLHIVWLRGAEVAERGTVVELGIHRDRLHVLEQFKPKRQQLILC
jgi:hypothetical protein